MQTSPPQETERDRLSVPISADLKVLLKIEAVKRSATMAALVEEALTEFLSK